MKSKLITHSAAALALVLFLAPVAAAQSFEIGFGRSSHKGRNHRSSSKGFDIRVVVPIGGSCEAPAHRHHDGCKQWVPGRVEVVRERVWVPGCTRQEWVPPCYETRYDRCGNPIQVLRSPGHYRTVQDPGRYEIQERHVRHEGRWVYSCGY